MEQGNSKQSMIKKTAMLVHIERKENRQILFQLTQNSRDLISGFGARKGCKRVLLRTPKI